MSSDPVDLCCYSDSNSDGEEAQGLSAFFSAGTHDDSQSWPSSRWDDSNERPSLNAATSCDERMALLLPPNSGLSDQGEACSHHEISKQDHGSSSNPSNQRPSQLNAGCSPVEGQEGMALSPRSSGLSDQGETCSEETTREKDHCSSSSSNSNQRASSQPNADDARSTTFPWSSFLQREECNQSPNKDARSSNSYSMARSEIPKEMLAFLGELEKFYTKTVNMERQRDALKPSTYRRVEERLRCE